MDLLRESWGCRDANMIEYVMSQYVIKLLGFAGLASSPGAGISSSVQQGTDQAMVVLCGGQHQGTPARMVQQRLKAPEPTEPTGTNRNPKISSASGQ